MPDLSDDVILGADLGSLTIATWLVAAEDNAKSIKLTRAQAVAKLEQSAKDEVNLQASGASPHQLQDIFDFSDFFFAVNATTSVNCDMPVPFPAIISDSTDHALLVEQQQSDPSLATIRHLTNKSVAMPMLMVIWSIMTNLKSIFQSAKLFCHSCMGPMLLSLLMMGTLGALWCKTDVTTLVFLVLLGQILAVTNQNM